MDFLSLTHEMARLVMCCLPMALDNIMLLGHTISLRIGINGVGYLPMPEEYSLLIGVGSLSVKVL